MDKVRSVQRMIEILLEEEPKHSFYADGTSKDYAIQRKVLRGLMNLRDPLPMNPEFLKLQDELLQEELEERGVINVFSLPGTSYPKIALYQGDITRLKADAIVNAANSSLLGCFVPGHNCIDNCIHSRAGIQLRDECHKLMLRKGHEEETGRAEITKGYNLPAKYVIHTVGPIVETRPTSKNQNDLASCYTSCLDLAIKYSCKSIVFPCLSTGVFNYPKKEAAETAIKSVDYYMVNHPDCPVVVFDVFLDEDFAVYSKLLG
ncbi:MAG: protein-ADP-ribose hydrolase [Bacilli bacterium]|jgi:O-acetyl-ADP-ribose deacetylase (regulator of RNase III)|nr:protein-ADP-ribose hydrolase [Bacilli bacterium]MCH4210405.1 protein-ADP-ribose hydrolase [Bacilli bacterium]MCH4228919.1 protein-ADP-ribose hydrolase [Bacilli bacterium]MCH4277545.1 protein-ADP-ribose hydrolase [Bacilli bacterium]MCI2055047.1 protein-ADP-ribose hydrolase [Bacilli bacterium]